jgi:hypothetical protein
VRAGARGGLLGSELRARGPDCKRQGSTPPDAAARPPPGPRPLQAATYCQIEAHVLWDKIIVHPPEGERGGGGGWGGGGAGGPRLPGPPAGG